MYSMDVCEGKFSQENLLWETRKSFEKKFESEESLDLYLEDLFNECFASISMSSPGKIGVRKEDFLKAIEGVPAFLCERIFNLATSKGKHHYLDLNEFKWLFNLLKYGAYDSVVEFIFNLVDTNKDKLIQLDELRQVCFLLLGTDIMPLDENLALSVDFSNASSEAYYHFYWGVDLDLNSFNELQVKTNSHVTLALLSYFLKTIDILKNSMLMHYVKAESSKTNAQGSFCSKDILVPQEGKDYLCLKPQVIPSHLPGSISSPTNAENKFLESSLNHCSTYYKDFASKLCKNDINEGNESPYLILPETFQDSQAVVVTSPKEYNIDHVHDNPSATHLKTQPVKNFVSEELNKLVLSNIKIEGKFLVQFQCESEYDSNHPEEFHLVLLDNCLYFYRTEGAVENVLGYDTLRSMVGAFIKTNPKASLENTEYFSLTLIFPTCESIGLFTTEKSLYLDFIDNLRKSIDYLSFFDHYNLQKEIGQGSFGKVYLATKNSSYYAVKILDKSKLKDKTMIKNELDILRLVRHENIIALEDHYENSAFHFLVMEYMPLGSLGNYINSKNKTLLGESDIKSITIQLLKSLSALRKAGIVHKDIKLENLLVREKKDANDASLMNLEVKLADFGLAMVLGKNDYFVDRSGTLGFTAPEVLLKKLANSSVDIWSLGISTYYLLTGRLPYQYSNKSELIHCIKNGELFFSFPSETSTLAIDFVNKCLVFKPEKRPNPDMLLKHQWFS